MTMPVGLRHQLPSPAAEFQQDHWHLLWLQGALKTCSLPSALQCTPFDWAEGRAAPNMHGSQGAQAEYRSPDLCVIST